MKKAKGAQDRFIPKTHIAKHREWRGLKDTWYDYTQWIKILGIMGGFVAKSPVRIMRGMLEYRWMGSYLAALNMIDRTVEGLEGEALRAARIYLETIMKGSTTQIANMMKGDRRFGENKLAGKTVVLEQTMSPELLLGFPKLIPMQLESFQGLLGCYMDQHLNPHYIDAMENLGLPSDSCRLSNNAAGVAIMDDYAQTGACLIMNNMPCDSSTMNSQLIDRRIPIPSMPACIPMRWEDRDTDEFAVNHMRDVIKFIEDNTGEKYDWNALREGVKKHNAEVTAELNKWDFMSSAYCPLGLSVSSLFHAYYYTFSGGRDKNVLKAEKKIEAIMNKVYTEKINCFPKARHRMIIWGGPACYWLDFPNWLYNCWGLLTVAQMDNFAGNQMIDDSTEETMLSGIVQNCEKGIMRRHLTGGWEHLFEFWEEAERFNCDMVLLNDDITCKGALGLSGMVYETAKDKDIKLMVVSNDMFDHRTISRSDMRKEVNQFMTSVMQEEPLDASLLDYDDELAW